MVPQSAEKLMLTPGTAIPPAVAVMVADVLPPDASVAAPRVMGLRVTEEAETEMPMTWLTVTPLITALAVSVVAPADVGEDGAIWTVARPAVDPPVPSPVRAEALEGVNEAKPDPRENVTTLLISALAPVAMST